MCIDFYNDPKYIITLKNPKAHHKEVVSKGEGGYPSVVGYFSLEDTFSSIERAQDYINTIARFNMWKPREGLTLDNIKIQRITFKFKDIEKK